MRLTAPIVYETINAMNREGGLMTPLNVLGVTAQTYHETGNYKHTAGEGNYNLGGIKCSRNWMDGRIPWSTKKCLNLKTQEYTGGEYEDFRLGFRWYDSLGTYLKDHARLINLFYPVAKVNADCVWGYVAGLHGKWATDHRYFYSVSKCVMTLAPRFIGNRWRHNLRISLDHAIGRRVLSREQEEWLRGELG